MSDVVQRVTEFRNDFQALRQEIGKAIVGNQEIVDGVLTCLFAGGNCLLEGVPGLGKTLLVRTLSQVLELKFSRIQFTPDLMPADILGTNLVMETPSGERMFKFQPGPLFAQIVLADEVNRATPKTQSALLEAMQEHTATIGGTQYKLPEPFFVMATQNPIEMEGTYPLPEAQLDRFFFKLLLKYSTLGDLKEILSRTTDATANPIGKVMDGGRIEAHKRLVKEVVAAPHIKDYVARIVLATHPKGEHAPDSTNRFLRFGSSPRGAQCMILAAKVRALLDGRYNVSFEDVRQSAFPTLRHRLILNFEGEAEGVEADQVIAKILEHVPTEPSAAKAPAPAAAPKR
ncbi:MAG: MoxR family ATPase [Planctomycetes bacterium]|nr:MoxR family ATPase [Planctomycetota bacterium]